MTGQRIPCAPDHIALLLCRATEAEQLHAGHLEAHAVVGQGKWRGNVSGQPCGEDIRLRQTGGDQAKRLAVNFTAFANGVDVRRGGLHLVIHHDAARAANAAGLRQYDVGLHARRQHHARGGDAASVQQRHAIPVNRRDARGEFTAHAPRRQRLFQQHARLLIQLLLHQPRTAMNKGDVVP